MWCAVQPKSPRETHGIPRRARSYEHKAARRRMRSPLRGNERDYFIPPHLVNEDGDADGIEEDPSWVQQWDEHEDRQEELWDAAAFLVTRPEEKVPSPNPSTQADS